MAGPSATLWFFRCSDGDVFPLEEGKRVIGRGDGADVCLDDDLVSREHAELEIATNGVRLRDLGSRNGVYLRERKLGEGEVADLTHGDAVIVGRTTLLLRKESTRGRKVTVDARFPEPRVRPIGGAGSTGMGLPYWSFLEEADRAAGRGDLARLETATHVALQMLTNAVRKGIDHDDPAIANVVGHALTLAEKRGKGWVERVFMLYEAGPIVVPLDVLSAIEHVVATHGLASRKPVESYIEALRETLGNDARGRALVAQIARLVSG